MRALPLVLVLLAGCASGFKPSESLPVHLAAAEIGKPAASRLDAEEIAARVARSVVFIEVEPRPVKTAGAYIRDLGTSFVSMLSSPLYAPVFVFDFLFGWLDFSTFYGSGFIVSSRGHVITNAHVVSTADEVKIERPDGKKGRARVVARDDDRDLALLRLDLPAGTELSVDDVMPIGSSSETRLGQRVVLYGFPGRPFPQEGPNPTVTAGIVSSLGLDVGEAAPRIQLDAAANGGSSGEPVIDEHGRAIGVVTEAANPASYSGQTFAIPIDDVMKAFFKQGEP